MVGLLAEVLIVRLIVMACGLLVTPTAVDAIVTVAEYVPATRTPTAGVSVRVDGAVEPFSVAVSHPLG